MQHLRRSAALLMHVLMTFYLVTSANMMCATGAMTGARGAGDGMMHMAAHGSAAQTVEGRERYGVRVRYPQELRDSPTRLASVLVPTQRTIADDASAAGGMEAAGMPPARGRAAQIPLGEIATIKQVAGPMVVRTEGAMPTAWVYVDVAGRDIGSYVADAQRMVTRMVTLPAGYSIVWSGQFEYMQSAKARMKLVIPAALAVIVLLLYFNFKSVGETLIVLLSCRSRSSAGSGSSGRSATTGPSRWPSASSRSPAWPPRRAS